MSEEAKWEKTIIKKMAKMQKLQEEKSYNDFVFTPIISVDGRIDFSEIIVKLMPTGGLHKGRIYYMKIYTKYKNNSNIIKYFPFSPPRVIFLTKMWHSNIYGSGDVCLDILKDQWSAIYNIDTVVLSILNLLDNPNPKSAANAVAAEQEIRLKKHYSELITKNMTEEEKDNIKRDVFTEYLNSTTQFVDYNEKIAEEYQKLFN